MASKDFSEKKKMASKDSPTPGKKLEGCCKESSPAPSASDQPWVEVLYNDYSDTDEEYEAEYFKQVTESDGFDVEAFPSRGPDYLPLGYITPLFEWSAETDKLLYDLSSLAINLYNQQNNANYEVVKVVKANARVRCGIQYYITYEAQDCGIDCPPQTFQASVLSAHDGNEVMLQRMKPSPK